MRPTPLRTCDPSSSKSITNSYLDHDHVFSQALREEFEDYRDLLELAVGMNVWHFQQTSNAASAPKPLIEFCRNTSRDIIGAMQPRHVLCFGKPAFELCGYTGAPVDDAGKACVANAACATWWYVPHLAGSMTRRAAPTPYRPRSHC